MQFECYCFGGRRLYLSYLFYSSVNREVGNGNLDLFHNISIYYGTDYRDTDSIPYKKDVAGML